MSLNLGDQIEAEWVPLLGLSYDPKDDAFDVMLKGLDHRIAKPSTIYLEDSPVGLCKHRDHRCGGYATDREAAQSGATARFIGRFRRAFCGRSLPFDDGAH